MANKDQLRIIQQGVEAWNKWREENPDERIDLRKASLFKANLSGANLSQADLRESDLREANISRAKLSRADLRKADISRADISNADISKASLFKAKLGEVDLHGADLRGTLLSRAHLAKANFHMAKLSGACLCEAGLSGADLREADLEDASLRFASLREADLSKASLRRSDLRGASLDKAILIKTNLTDAILTDCRIHGISTWRLKLEGAEQKNLAVTPFPISITIDNLEVAQSLYLLLHDKKIRGAIDAISLKAVLILGRLMPKRRIVLDALREELRGRGYIFALFLCSLLYSMKNRGTIAPAIPKVVLILGRFMPEKFMPKRRVVLDALREELRGRGYSPVLFPFKEPHPEDSCLEDSFLEDRLILDPIETVSTLAHMARFIIADITDAKGLLTELESIVSGLPLVPVMPIVPYTGYEDGLLKQIRRYPWVLEPYRYEDQAQLIASLGEKVIAPAEKKVIECRRH